MIHIATVHFKSPKWIDIQLSYLARHLQEPYRVVANLQDVEPGHEQKFDRVVPAMGGHPGKLNLMASLIVEEADHDDLIMFIDGDAFPITDPMPTVRKGLDDSVLVAVRRDEVAGDRQPHPCFCVIRAEDWDRLRGDWSPGYFWTNDRGQALSDVGGNLLGILDRTKSPWTPLLRSNKRNRHPIWFAVYADIVYHHGAGFRDAVVLHNSLNDSPAWMNQLEKYRVLASAVRHVDAARIKVTNYRSMKANHEMGAEIYSKIQTDPFFYEEFI